MGFGEQYKRGAVEWKSDSRATGRVLDVKLPDAKTRRKREKYQADTPRWLRHYFPGIYRLPFGTVHHEIIEATDYTINNAGRCVVAAPRGTGKSYVLDGVAFKAVIEGRVRFPVVIPWDTKGLKKALSFWKKALCFNPLLAHDYSEWCAPFVACRGSSQKCLTYTDADENPIGARLLMSEGMIVLPGSRGVIGGATINGNPLGMNYTTDSGEGLRPDLILIDDPQDRDTAMSPTQIKSTIELIDFDISGMAGPDTAMPMLMACTVKQRDDVAEHYLDGGAWRPVRVPQIVKWPKNRDKWDDWNAVRQSGEESKDGDKSARDYYRKHAAALKDGMEVSWDDRYVHKSTDSVPAQPDAFYSAMYDFYAMGESAFMAERQNEPMVADASQYELNTATVCAHTIPLPRLQLPEFVTIFTGHVDINRAGLHWCVAGFGQDMTGHAPAYGKWPKRGVLWDKNAPELVRKQAIFKGLGDLCAEIAATQFTKAGEKVRLSALLVDRGYEPDVVHKFAAASAYPFQIVPARGYAGHKYAPRKAQLVGRPMEGCHVTKSQYGDFLAFNADMWRETAQRAFLAEPGAPGGFTLFDGGAARYHMPFAEHVVAERLVNKYETDMGLRWEFVHRPGALWDWGDALTGCWVGAAAAGLSASGIQVRPKRRPTGRKVRHVQI